MRNLNKSNLPFPLVMCNDYTALKDILLRTQSWLIATEFHFEEELKRGELIKLDIQHPALNIDLSIIELKGRPRSPAAEAFIDILCKDLDRLIP